MINIAVLITSHNRKEKTKACLDALYLCHKNNLFFQVYLVDDGSSDGTSEMIRVNFPQVKIIQGSGDLYWAGGMRIAWEAALQNDYDGFLLLNDDTVLYKDALTVLLETNSFITEKYNSPGISIGSTCDPDTGVFTYGAYKLRNRITPQASIVYPGQNQPLRGDFANANIMMVPKEVIKKIGILSKTFTHSLADYDYTLRATENGIPVVVSKSYCGSCMNDHGKNWLSADYSLSERIAYLKNPKYLAYHEHLRYVKIHFPFYLPISLLLLWARTFFPGIWDRFKDIS